MSRSRSRSPRCWPRAAACALLLAALIAVAGHAGAHGATVTKEKDVGPYHVIYYTSDFITEHESMQFAWNVTDVETRDRVAIEHPVVRVRLFDSSGELLKDEEMTPEQPVDGILTLNMQVGPAGRVNHTLFLPDNHTVQFEDQVQGLFDPGRGTGSGDGDREASRGSPLPAPLALAALAIAGIALHRRSPRRPGRR